MNLHPDTARSITAEAVKATATAGAAVLGLSLDTWVKVATLCAILLNLTYSAWKWHRDWRRTHPKGTKL